jgi:hypothetical protein
MCIDLSKLAYLRQDVPSDVNSADGRADFIATHAAIFGAHCWKEFTQRGRGALKVFVGPYFRRFGYGDFDLDGLGISLRYFTAAELAAEGITGPLELDCLLQSYIPEREFVLILFRVEGQDLRVKSFHVLADMMGVAPPDAFRELAKAKPRLADGEAQPELPYRVLYRRRRSFDDTPDGRIRMMSAHGRLLAAIAWAGFILEGRGAVIVDMRPVITQFDLDGLAFRAIYSPSEKLTILRATELPGFTEALKIYNPAAQLIILLLIDGAVKWALLSPRAGHPPDAFMALALVKGAVCNN